MDHLTTGTPATIENAQALANTDEPPGDVEGWTILEQYQEVIEYAADHPNPGSSSFRKSVSPLGSDGSNAILPDVGFREHPETTSRRLLPPLETQNPMAVACYKCGRVKSPIDAYDRGWRYRATEAHIDKLSTETVETPHREGREATQFWHQRPPVRADSAKDKKAGEVLAVGHFFRHSRRR